MTFGSLFAGIGGMDLGLERAGMACQWQVEIEPYARRVLAKHWPDVRRWDDVRTFPPDLADAECVCGESGRVGGVVGRKASSGEADRKERQRDGGTAHDRGSTLSDWSVDLIAGGFPCQDISFAGKGAGLHLGERSGLFFEFVRIVRTLEPRFVLLENVPALISGETRVRYLPDRCLCGWPHRWRRLHLAEQVSEQIWLHLFGESRGWDGAEGLGRFDMACEHIRRNDSANAEFFRTMDGGGLLGPVRSESRSVSRKDSSLPEAQAEPGRNGDCRPAFGERWMDRREQAAWLRSLRVDTEAQRKRARARVGELLSCPACGRNLGDGAEGFIQRSWMGDVLGTLASIGYDAEWFCLPAAAVGAPHIRDRVFIVANTVSGEGGERCEPDVQRRRSSESEQTRMGGGRLPRTHRPRLAQRERFGRDARAELAAFERANRQAGGQWGSDPADEPQSGVGRVAYGIPHRVDRLRGLGNAVVPQVAEFIGRRILEFDNEGQS